MSPVDLKNLELQDHDTITRILAEDPPEISELTFTNLFIWRYRYHPLWAVVGGVLLVVMQPEDGEPYALPPTGPGDKAHGLEMLVELVRAKGGSGTIARVPEPIAALADPERFAVTADPDQSDYVYLRQELVDLRGKRFHKKRNHLNRFLAGYKFEYKPFGTEEVECVLDMQNDWCKLRNCADNPGLASEDQAVFEALTHTEYLGFFGGTIVIDKKVEAFSLGEMLSPSTAVVHIEKANTEINGLYAAINQRFCQETLVDAEYVNREQDLGVEGLKRAKRSYNPHHMVDKFVLTPRF